MKGATSVFSAWLRWCRPIKPESLGISRNPSQPSFLPSPQPVSLLLPTEGRGLGQGCFFSAKEVAPGAPPFNCNKETTARPETLRTQRESGCQQRHPSTFVTPHLRWHQVWAAWRGPPHFFPCPLGQRRHTVFLVDAVTLETLSFPLSSFSSFWPGVSPCGRMIHRLP